MQHVDYLLQVGRQRYTAPRAGRSVMLRLHPHGYKVLHFYTEDFWGDEGGLIQRIRDAWHVARNLLPVRVQPKHYVPNGPGRSVVLPLDLQEAVDILHKP